MRKLLVTIFLITLVFGGCGGGLSGDKEQDLVEKYIKQNINEISPMEPVLGGTWQVLDVEFLEGKIVDVTYEDGEVQAWLEAEYKVLGGPLGRARGGEVSLSNIQVLEEGGDGGETRN